MILIKVKSYFNKSVNDLYWQEIINLMEPALYFGRILLIEIFGLAHVGLLEITCDKVIRGASNYDEEGFKLDSNDVYTDVDV